MAITSLCVQVPSTALKHGKLSPASCEAADMKPDVHLAEKARSSEMKSYLSYGWLFCAPARAWTWTSAAADGWTWSV